MKININLNLSFELNKDKVWIMFNNEPEEFYVEDIRVDYRALNGHSIYDSIVLNLDRYNNDEDSCTTAYPFNKCFKTKEDLLNSFR